MNIELSNLEKIELEYFYVKGFRYIAKNENGNPKIFKKKPIREKSGSCYGIWIIEDNYPIEDFSEYEKLTFSDYSFIKYEDEPMEIGKLLQHNKTK